MDVITLITMLVGFLTMSGITIGLFLHLYTKIDNSIAASAQETKDFHGRLCSLEARWHGKPLDDEKEKK